MRSVPQPDAIEMEGTVARAQVAASEGTAEGTAVNPFQYPMYPVHPPLPILGGENPQTRNETRYLYGYFAIAMALYHGFWTIMWLIIMAVLIHVGVSSPLCVFCGLFPSLMTVIWIIIDATVCCCNSGVGAPIRICCCPCFLTGKWTVALPMGIATFLRFVLFIVIFGHVADILKEYQAKEHIDNVFWIILSYAAFDGGPMILLTIDWWFYYSESSRNGLFGTKTNPMRCVVGQSTLLFVASWSFVAMIGEYAKDQVAELSWPWIVHGVVSTAVLIFCATSSRHVVGNKLPNESYRYISWVLAAAMGITVFVIVVFAMELLVDGDGSAIFVVMYLYYYTSLSVPSVVAMASFKVQAQMAVA